MKRLLTLLTCLCLFAMAHPQGVPFIRNFTAKDYHANNTNFDIETDAHGNVFVANFEGLMYYDYAEWRIIRTPDITRVTVVYRASDNTIWVGGYNYFGKVERKANGEITLRRIGSPTLFHGEVDEIYELDGVLHFIAGDAVIYQVRNDKVTVKKKVDKESLKMGMLDVVNVEALEEGKKDITQNDTIQTVALDNGLKAIVRKNIGIIIADAHNHPLYTITDTNGLCSSNVSYTTYDGRGHLWGATGKGVFVIQIPSAITRFTSNEGLHGTTYSIGAINDRIYVGTDEGLFRQDGHHFIKVPDVPHACWELKKSSNGLLAATADGLCRILPDGRVRFLTTTNTLTMLDEGSLIYCGEADGIYTIQPDGRHHVKVYGMENVKKIVKDKSGTIWVQSLYGRLWQKSPESSQFQVFQNGDKEAMQTIVMDDGNAVIVSAESTAPLSYPLVSYVDDTGVTWLTNNEGKKLYRWKGGKKLSDLDHLLFPVNDTPIRSIFTKQNEIWLGNDIGLAIINTQTHDPYMASTPRLHIRSARLGSDSILWGGFGTIPEALPALKHNENSLHFTFSLESPSIAGETMYRYRLNDGKWSNWSTNTWASFSSLTSGHYTFSVQARDIMNRVSDVASIKFRIKLPFYYRWYMNLLYLLLLTALVYLFFQLRLRRLEKEKVRLEEIVNERTAEVVRLEKMAAVGKLTQGLIDRILNPLNYIINFAKLSEGLVKDARANVEDEQEHMDSENYDDTLDVLDMLAGNLQKVGEHGQNTTRTLKAMEEMLKDHSGGIIPMDLLPIIRQDKMILDEYFKKDISEYNIQIVFQGEGEQPVNGNADQLSKVIMNLLSNAIYAVVKKAEKVRAREENPEAYAPMVALQATRQKNLIRLNIRDNGIGIEATILDKIFDPFFTTKTTGEAAGVGLYLCREIIQNHGGDIQVKSVKDKYTEFIITLPVKKA